MPNESADTASPPPTFPASGRGVSTADGTRDILDYWFREIGPDRWWAGRSQAVDDAIRTRFLALWEEWRGHPAEQFLATADKALAAIVLFDQFSRNMFRGDARAFATDALALKIASGAIDKGYEARLTRDERSFLYMPFQHAEDLAMQDRAIALFSQLDLPDSLKYARAHREIIARFGRFPARNAALGREDRPGEAEAIAATASW
jgi:uncharacterized protein (DUF924 family)